MPAPSTGLARLTISSPQRRVDVALPDGVPVAEVLPELLRHAGEGLADDGERHGGWLLRKADGVSLAPSATLAGQGVRDGAVLHLVPAQAQWPELEYDDVVEAIAAGARRQGMGWTGAATRAVGLAAAGVALAVGLVAVTRTGSNQQLAALAALVVAAALVLAGVIASRAYGDAFTGAALAGYALPYAFVGGAQVLATGDSLTGVDRDEFISYLLVGSVTLLLVSLVAAVGVAHALRLFIGGVTAGLFGVVGAVSALLTTTAGAAAVVIAVLVAGVAAIPLLAIRLGKLPMPVLTLPTDLSQTGRELEPPPDRARVFAAVARTDEMLTGMLLGLAVCVTVASFVVARYGGFSGRLLVGVASAALLLRARLFVTVRQRLPLLATGLAGLGLLAVGAVFLDGNMVNLIVAVALAACALTVASTATRYASRSPSPYLGRAADVLDVLCIVSVVPIACAVLGLYGLARGITG